MTTGRIIPNPALARAIARGRRCMRDRCYELKAIQTAWFNGQSSEIANDATEYDAREGVEGLAGSDVWLFTTQVSNYISLIEQAGVLNVVSKPCVRSVKVDG